MSVRMSPTQNWTGSDARSAILEGETVSDLTLYVATTGSDVTGNGTALLPYATVVRAMQDVPRVIAHKVKILITAGTYASGWPTHIDPVFIDDGSLTLIGVGVPTHISGPHLVTGVADLGTGGQRVTVAAGGIGAVDTACGQTIMIATGGHVAQAHQIVGNTDTTIDLLLHSDKVHNGDTFDVIEPAVKISLEGCNFRYDSRSQYYGLGGSPYAISRLVLHNIWLDASASTVGMGQICFAATGEAYSGFYLDFVRITGSASAFGAVLFIDANLNQYGTHATDYILDGATGIANLSTWGNPGLSVETSGDRATNQFVTRGRCVLSDFVCKGALWGVHSHLDMGNFGLGSLFLNTQSRVMGLIGVVVGKAGTIAAEAEGYDLIFSDIHFLLGTAAMKVRRGGYASIGNLTCDIAGITGSAMDIGALCRVRQATALPNFKGATVARAAYRLTAPSVDINGAVWLASAGDTATDSMGSFITFGD